MDTSETCIRMVDCPEIQGQWEPKAGDILWHGNYGILLVHRILKGGHFGTVQQSEPNIARFWDIGLDRAIFTWLPRQEDLQAMMPQSYLLVCFFDWWKDLVMIPPLASMEQLWLAYVMKEKHNKVWADAKWSNEEGD